MGNGSDTLVWASVNGHLGMVAIYLVAEPSDRKQKMLNDALRKAIAEPHKETVRLVLHFGAKITDASFSMLLHKKDIGNFETMVEYGFDVNSREFMGETALRLALRNPELIKWLLDHGAKPDLPNTRGVTPLATCALLPVSPELVKTLDLLLARGADISNEPDILHRAMRPTALGGTEMVKLLLAHGANSTHVHPDTGTPLHYAASLGKKEEVSLLMKTQGVDVGPVVDGLTAADVARMREEFETAELLGSQCR